ncbi:distal tail protein Dit [Lysinibacillus sp. NPDC086135]|uniref:distal tail protein Dit n=1 Tax=Lysinibacillus sp. NPDC086135 TaxID=3364130 RepID=UPI00381E0C8F
MELMDGTRIDTFKNSMYRLEHNIPSINIEHETVHIDGRRGNLITKSMYTERIISVRFIYDSYDINDFYLLRDEINALFTRNDAFYIIFKTEPYKKYKVRMNGSINLPVNMHMDEFIIEFMCDDVCGLSTFPTSKFSKEWDIDMFAWNGEITWDEDIAYTFTNTNSFSVINLGTADIDPRQDYLKINLNGLFATSVTITNLTTGDKYVIDTSLSSNENLQIIGTTCKKNGQSIFKYVRNKKELITLAKGENKFVIEGGSVNSISFDFNFLYL